MNFFVLLSTFRNFADRMTKNENDMKKDFLLKLTLLLVACHLTLGSPYSSLCAQGWPQQYGGVMLQGFYWDSYDDSQWAVLEKQADDLAASFALVWIPQSGNCGGQSMGYDDLYWFPGSGHYDSSFGTEAQLRSMISTFKAKGIGTIADVVINHRRNVSSWTDFPAETYNGVTYQLTYQDICKNDEAAAKGHAVGPNNDTGEGWDGMRDLDHKSANVQNSVKAYLDMLLNDLGYIGFRYDMVKGYAAEYTKMYNESAKPQFSVGECWDGTNTIRNWIDGTGKTSAAFDFQFRYTVRNAAHSGDWTQLGKTNEGNWPLVSKSLMSGSYRQWAVTFVENHDTEKRSNAAQDPLKKDTLAANAFMLAMPGTPCVFLKHWQAYKPEIKAMIEARQLAGIHNMSETVNMASSRDYYAICSTGSKGQLLAVVGTKANTYAPNGSWTRILSGYHYTYFLQSSMNTAWVSLGSGSYEGEQQAVLTAVSDDADAKLVYTLDGTTPTAASPSAASGTSITLPIGQTVLTVGLLTGGSVTGIITRTVTCLKPEEKPQVQVPSFCTVNEGEVCAFFEAPTTWSNTIKCWAWTDSPSDNFTGGSWPGVSCELLGTADNGKKVWKWTWNGKKQNNSSAKQPAMIIFNNSGQPQTADLVFKNGGYYDKDGLQAIVSATAIDHRLTTVDAPDVIYDLQGRKVEGHYLRKGIYVRKGENTKKFINK